MSRVGLKKQSAPLVVSWLCDIQSPSLLWLGFRRVTWQNVDSRISLASPWGGSLVPQIPQRANPPLSGPGTCLPQAQGWPSLAWGLGNCVHVGLGPYFPKLAKDPDPWSLLSAGFLCLRFHSVLAFTTGITILGICHYTLTVKGSHLATHGALTESKRWNKILMIFFVEVRLAVVGQAVAGHLHVGKQLLQRVGGP